MLELLTRLDGFDSRGDVKVHRQPITLLLSSFLSLPFPLLPSFPPSQSYSLSLALMTGYHGDKPHRVAGPCPHPPGAHRPQDRVPAARREDQATHLHDPHIAHDPRCGRQTGGVCHGQGRSLRRRYQGMAPPIRLHPLPLVFRVPGSLVAILADLLACLYVLSFVPCSSVAYPQAICTEAGLMALRERRMCVNGEDFRKSKENVLYRKSEGTPQGLPLFLLSFRFFSINSI